MNKNKLSIFLLLFALIFQANALYSQSLQTVPKIGLGINGLDFSVEIPVARKIIIEPAVGFGPSYDFYQNENQDGLMQLRWYIFNPSVHLSVYGKFFLNRNKRMLQGKSLLYNSGKFIGVKVKYVSRPILNTFEAFDLTNTLLFNAHVGMQRNIGNRWNYSFSVGAGYGRNLDVPFGALYPAIDLKIAYVLPWLNVK